MVFSLSCTYPTDNGFSHSIRAIWEQAFVIYPFEAPFKGKLNSTL